jgi:hypothetical protein
MTEAEARDLCAQLAREHPDRAANQWFARETEDGWTVVNPRPAHQRNVPGAWG